MSNKIICKSCNSEITHKNDLITIIRMFKVVPYHSECYSNEIKGAKALFRSNAPISGKSGNLSLVFTFLLATFLIIYLGGVIRFIAMLGFLIPLGYRLYSYYSFEQHLE